MSTDTNIAIYETHDNGGRPFTVHIHLGNLEQIPKKVSVHLTYHDMLPYYIIEKPLNVWIGKSPKNAMTAFSGGFGDEFDGNSILVQKTEHTYVFIGTRIYSFRLVNKPENKIVSYVSPVGNSDVAYPYALDSYGNYYLMLERDVLHIPEHVTIKEEDMDKVTHQIDPYNVYYNKESYKGLVIRDIPHFNMIRDRSI
jgi:hypothetical protein